MFAIFEPVDSTGSTPRVFPQPRKKGQVNMVKVPSEAFPVVSKPQGFDFDPRRLLAVIVITNSSVLLLVRADGIRLNGTRLVPKSAPLTLAPGDLINLWGVRLRLRVLDVGSFLPRRERR